MGEPGTRSKDRPHHRSRCTPTLAISCTHGPRKRRTRPPSEPAAFAVLHILLLLVPHQIHSSSYAWSLPSLQKPLPCISRLKMASHPLKDPTRSRQPAGFSHGCQLSSTSAVGSHRSTRTTNAALHPASHQPSSSPPSSATYSTVPP